MTAPGIPPAKAIGEAVVGTAAEAAHTLFPAVIGPPGSGPPPIDEFVLDPKFKDLAGDPTVSGGQIPVDLQKSTELTGKPDGVTRPGYAKKAQEPIDVGGDGGAIGGLSGSVSGTVGPQIPGELVAAQQAYATNSAMIEKLGYQARFDALGLVVDVNGEIDELWRADFKGTSKRMRSMLDEAEEEVSGIRDFMEAARADQINSGEFFANIGGAGRFGAAMALGAGAMATAFGGGPNAALQIITQAIDRNVRAQVANQTHNRALIAHQNNFVNTLRGLAGDEMQYANFLRIGYTAMAKNRVAKITAGYGQAQAKLAFQDVDNKLGARLAEAEIRALTAAQQKVTFKFKSMAQYSKAQRLLGGAAPSGGAGRGTGSSIASRRRRGGTPQGASQPSQVTLLKSGTPKAKIDHITDQFVRLSDGSSPGVPAMSNKEIAQLQKQTVAQLRASGDAVTADSLQQLGGTSLISNRKMATEGIFVAGFGERGAIPGKGFIELPEAKKVEGRRAVGTAATALEYSRDIYELLSFGSFKTEGAFSQHLATVGDSRLALPARDPAMAEILAEIERKALWIEENIRKTKGTRNAINTLPEMKRAAKESGRDMSIADVLTNLWLNNADLRKARYEPTIEIMENTLGQVETDWDLRLVNE